MEVLETERKWLKKESLNIRKEERTKEGVKLWVNTIALPSSFKFSKLYLIVESKIVNTVWCGSQYI